MIELKHLSAGYYGNPVIQDITMDFKPGELLVLVGPNGSGKSTLLKAALGLLERMDGSVLYDGQDILTLSRKQIARQAAFLTQSRNTPSIVAKKMVLHGRFPYLSYPRRYSPWDYAVVEKAMELTGTKSYQQTNVSELSGGQRQGVYLAMTLAQDTKTVFMDEPTTYLDVQRQLQLIRTAKNLAKDGKAVVLVLHDLPLALRFADRIAVFQNGKLAAWDAPEAVYRSSILSQVFDVEIHRVETPYGTQYFCAEKEW